MGRHKTKDIDWLVKRMDTLALHSHSDSITADSTTTPTTPFRFLDLPYELRLRVYEDLLIAPKTIDLDPSNIRTVAPRLRLLFVNRQIHDEASRVFYSRNTFRVFPIHGRYINKKHPLLEWLPRRYRAHITRLELRLGPGFTRPPKGWVVDSRLGLGVMSKVFKIRVFVEIDPASNEVFEGFRVGSNFYTDYAVNWLRGLLSQLPSVGIVEFDAYPGVPRSSPLLMGLVEETKLNQRKVAWGKERGWDKIVEIDLAAMLEKVAIERLDF